MMTMSFLMVGHTHEDIDAAFSKTSLRTKGLNIGTLPELMAEVWECMEDMHMVPGLIGEVVAYKAYLKRHKVKEIVGHSRPISFHFSMRDNRPIYQYKVDINSPWIPENGRCIWANDLVTKKLIIPMGEPYAKKMSHTYKKKDEVVPYLRKYIEHQLNGCTDPTSEEYKIKYPLSQYWKSVADTLEGDFGPETNSDSDSEDLEEGLQSSHLRFGPKQIMAPGTMPQSNWCRMRLNQPLRRISKWKILFKRWQKTFKNVIQYLWVVHVKKNKKLGIRLKVLKTDALLF